MRDPRIFSGVVVPMVSPFGDDGRPDTGAVARVVQFLLAAGVDAIFALGTTGEAASIAPADKRILAQAMVQAVGGKVTTYAGISGNCLSESLEAALAYHAMGITAVVAHPPCFYPVPDVFIERYFTKLADALPLPLLIYNIPQTTHMTISVQTVANLSRHPNIIGIKDSKPDFDRFKQIIAAVSGRPEFRVLVGASSLSYQALRAGAHGLVPSTANYAPGPYVGIYKSAIAGNWDQAQTLQREADELSARYQAGRTLGESLAVLKQLMARQGLCGTTTLPPLDAATETA